MKDLIEKLKLQIQILQIQISILLLKKKLTVPDLDKPKMVIVHHGGGNLDFEGVNEYHKQKWGFRSSLGYYIGYQKFIEFNGKLYIGRQDNEEGAHTKGFNKLSVGICLQGNMEEMKPTEAQLETLKQELDRYGREGLEIKAHQEFTPTLCPGKYLMEWLNTYRAKG